MNTLENEDRDQTHLQAKIYPRRADFIWLSSFFGLSIAFVCALTLSDNKRAAENLDFAAVLISIILAVIAIVYTFVSGEGQKETISKLENAVTELDGSVQTTRENLTTLDDVSLKLVALQVQLAHLIDSNEEWAQKLDAVIEQAQSVDEIKNYMKREKPSVSVKVDRTEDTLQDRVLLRRAVQMMQNIPKVMDSDIEKNLKDYMARKGGIGQYQTALYPMYYDDIIDRARKQFEGE